MKNIFYIVVIAFLTGTITKPFNNIDRIREDIKHSRVSAIQKFLKGRILSERTKDELHELAHKQLCMHKAELSNFSNNVGLTRKIIGIVFAGHALRQLTSWQPMGFVYLVIGTSIYNWGSNAEKQTSYESKAQKIEVFENARTIEQLINNAPVSEDKSDAPTKKD